MTPSPFVALLLLLCSLVARCEAAPTLPLGGCGAGTSGFKIHNLAENVKGVQCLIENNITFAILPAMVTNGLVEWDNGEPIVWVPHSFQSPPSVGQYRLVLQRTGAWAPVSTSLKGNYLCTDGMDGGATTTTTTTTTTSPPSSVPTVSSVMQTLRSVVFAAAPVVAVMDFTSNEVCLPATASLVQDMQLLQAASTAIAVQFGATGPTSTLSSRATTTTVCFQVPNELYNVSKVTSHSLSLTARDTYDVLATGSQLRVTPVMMALQQMAAGVMLSDDVTLEGANILATVRFAGVGTALPHTTDVSHVITSTLFFSMVNNGALGGRRTASTSPIPYLITRYNMRFFVPRSYLGRVRAGRKSVCATYNGKSVVVAPLVFQGVAAMTTAASFSPETAIPITLHGGTATSIASGAYAAFVSASPDCTSDGANISLLPLNSFMSGDSNPTVSALLVIGADVPAGRYVCMRRIASKMRFAVAYHGKPVTIGAKVIPPPAAATAPVLTIFNGSSGSLHLQEFVRPSASTDDAEAYLSALKTVSGAYRVFRFVAVQAGAAAADKKAACGRSRQEATQYAASGVMQFSFPLYLHQTHGVLCADGEYVRIDYTVLQPTNGLISKTGTGDIAPRRVVLSSGVKYDAVPFALSSSNPTSLVSRTMVRMSENDSCAFGYTVRMKSYGTQNYIAIPTALVGVYTVCVGIYNETGTSMFASTGLQVDFASYALARHKWMQEAGIDTTEWTPCGSASTCGLHTEQQYIQVCNGAIRPNVWPERLEGAFVGPGSVTVLMVGNLYKTPAIVLMNDVYVPVAAAFVHCQQFSMLELSTDNGETYGPAAVVLSSHPQILLNPSTDVSGVVVGFVPWGVTCLGAHVGSDVMVGRTETGVSVIDTSGLLFSKSEGYYAVCTRNGDAWAPVTDTYIKIVTGVVTMYGAEAISTGDALPQQRSIQLYQTQTATWAVVGTFSPSVGLVLKLVWNDATCKAAAAHTAPLNYISPSSSRVTVEVSLIAAAPEGLSERALYPCYAMSKSGSTASPLPFEERRGRSIRVMQLTLSSLFYLPYLVLSVSAPADTRILLTDPQNPPITRLALQVASSESDVPVCSVRAVYATVLAVETDDLGHRWVTVPTWVPQTLGGSGATNVYVKMCATASSSASPEFVPVDAYIMLKANGTRLAGDTMSLRLTFLPLNASTDVLDSKAARGALATYTATVLHVPETVVLVTSLGNNAFELFIDDALQTGAAPQSTMTPSKQLYHILAKGTNLPLFVKGSEKAMTWFVLSKAECVHLLDQTFWDAYSVLNLPTSGSQSGHPNYTALSIALFCVVVVPTAIGFVAFSIQQTIPTLSHSRFGKRATVFAEAGDSPPPRNPSSPVVPEAENSVKDKTGEDPLVRAKDVGHQSPLYASEEEGEELHDTRDMEGSPPLSNRTFFLTHQEGDSACSSAPEKVKR
ncbi:hypothetical protein JKF63_05737 [Porcisia hertigi]|uniref:Membrane-associated protein n=1 Tax=Porcisia hertigi TaxID=2761500 RepID=A0A836LCB9_9TRYP|nr:hypothetical protein JKF63_05737 [Porcisia hertigi]